MGHSPWPDFKCNMNFAPLCGLFGTLCLLGWVGQTDLSWETHCSQVFNYSVANMEGKRKGTQAGVVAPERSHETRVTMCTHLMASLLWSSQANLAFYSLYLSWEGQINLSLLSECSLGDSLLTAVGTSLGGTMQWICIWNLSFPLILLILVKCLKVTTFQVSLLFLHAASVCSDCSFQGWIGGQPPVTVFLNGVTAVVQLKWKKLALLDLIFEWLNTVPAQ